MQFQIYERELGKTLDRFMKVPIQTFGILRKQLIKNLGAERTRELLFNFGYEIGTNDANRLLELEKDKSELVKKGPIMHIENGQIEGIVHQCEAKFDENGKLLSIVGQGEWIGSFEAIQHINWFGPSTSPVCATLTGYASGYMSRVFGEELLAKELTCKAKGDSSCTWIIKTQRQWELESGDDYIIQNAFLIDRELKETYDQLLEQRDFIKKLLDFQKLISDELLKGISIDDLTKLAVKFLGNPLCIKDKHLKTLYYAGLHNREYTFLEEDFERYLKENEYDNIFLNQCKVNALPRKIDTGRQIRLTMPIIIKGQLLAWVFFIYDKKRHTLKQDEELFLERFSNAISILLLNERTKFESFERMKGHFLDQLLSNSLTESEILKRGLFAGIDLSNPYHIIVCDYADINDNFEVEEELLEFFFDYFHDREINALIGHRDGKIVFLISEYEEEEIKEILERLMKDTLKVYPSLKIYLGVSQQTFKATDVPYAFKQANIALRFIIFKNIIFYNDLGIISLLPKETDLESLRYNANRELGDLNNYDDEKVQELLKTLYVFLLNGGNLDKTRTMLNLSLSGLRHRLQNIEKQLNKDIRDPEVMYKLMLILKLLIISGELTFDLNNN